MADMEKLAEILREEYGINSVGDLNRAIANLGTIDLTPFCGAINHPEKECEHLDKSRKTKKAAEGAKNPHRGGLGDAGRNTVLPVLCDGRSC